MKIERKFTEAGYNPFHRLTYATFTVANPAEPDKPVEIEAPDFWSQNAVEILYSKYIRKAGVPVEVQIIYEKDIPLWLCRGKNYYNDPHELVAGETSAQQVVHRMAGHWTYAGWKAKYFSSEADAQAFYDELVFTLLNQMWAPNSPQWFNTGLWWAYGLEGDTINWRWERDMSDDVPITRARQITRKEAYRHPQTSACFIQSIDDSLIGPGGILDTLKAEASIFKYGSGSGINFSALRGKGQPLSGGGKSSGMMSFLEVFDKNAGSIKSGGTTRRAAKMVVVNADHPEAMEFVTWKAGEEAKVQAMGLGAVELLARDEEHQDLYGSTMLNPTARKTLEKLRDQIENPWEGVAYNTVSGQNSNNSLRVTDAWMRIAASGPAPDDWTEEHELFGALCHSTWSAGDPGMQFDDACNKWHTIPKVARQNATNPCSEYSFIDDSSCNLASINLHKFKAGDKCFDAERFAHLTYLITVCLDITVEMSSYPSAKIAENSAKYRPLGLGYANLGGLLMSMGIPYASEKGRDWAAAITNVMHIAAWRASEDMATELGAFFEFGQHNIDVLAVRNMHHEAHNELFQKILNTYGIASPITECVSVASRRWRSIGGEVRNAQLTLLAPTGTIGLLMDCATTGIEPDFALIKHKKRAGGGSMTIANPLVGEGMQALGYQLAEIDNALKALEAGASSLAVNSSDMPVFACANDIAWQDHLLMMAAVQPFLSGAISKTVNLPNSATVKDVADCYIMAWKLGLKAVAPYRDGSKGAQPLTAKKDAAEPIHPGFIDAVQKAGPLELDETGFLADEKLTAGKAKDIFPGLLTMVPANGGLREKTFEEIAIEQARAAVEALPADVRLTDAVILLESAECAVRDYVDHKPVMRRYVRMTTEGQDAGDIDDELAAHLEKTGAPSFNVHQARMVNGQPAVRRPRLNLDVDRSLLDAFEKAGEKLPLPEFAIIYAKAGSPKAERLDEVVKMVNDPARFAQFCVDHGLLPKKEDAEPRGRMKLPAKRRGFTAKAKIEGRSIFLRTGEYEDGRLGEIFLNMDREGSLTSLALNALAIAVSLGLQHGVPLDEFTDAFLDMAGGPMGSVVGPDDVRFCSSVVDWMARVLRAWYLQPALQGRRADLLIVDDVMAGTGDDATGDGLTHGANDPERFKGWDSPRVQQGRAGTALLGPVRAAGSMPYLDESCSSCGEKRLTRNGTCKVCQNCGTTTGCS
jgi:adenosylcobalamin-dependent ribonucleoside-diphosphate reductase